VVVGTVCLKICNIILSATGLWSLLSDRSFVASATEWRSQGICAVWEWLLCNILMVLRLELFKCLVCGPTTLTRV